ncbi:phosphotransferase enzyme family protein [Streptomyces violascens]|uniref:phosphotransferase enzyme family protein n=1 Tax=Streptomyces violascens TaxID=67381 RepID=UPI00369920CD
MREILSQVTPIQPLVNPHRILARSIIDALRTHYELSNPELFRVPAGQSTMNYMIKDLEATYFAKCYLPGTDIVAESEAIYLTELADRHGIPVAAVLLSKRGACITRHDDVIISVWSWVSGRTANGSLTTGQAIEAGCALGRMHRFLADHPASRGRPSLKAWMNPDLKGLEHAIGNLTSSIQSLHERDEFDEVAIQTLNERLAQLRHIPDLLESLPELTCQVLHGDYSTENVIYQGDQISAVVDFCPPSPFLISFELGRIAFAPPTVMFSDNWISIGRELIESYLRWNPSVSDADIQSCGRIAILKILRSLYGVENHYLSPGLIQKKLDESWVMRHCAAKRMLEHLEEIEETLSTVVRRS